METFYQNHLNIATRKVEDLRQRLEQFERENTELKRSIYELTIRLVLIVDASDRAGNSAGKMSIPLN